VDEPVETSSPKMSEQAVMLVAEPVEASSPKLPKSVAEPVEARSSSLSVTTIPLSKEEQASYPLKVFGKDPQTAHRTSNPIPMDPSLPDGLVFKVQIGAFRKPVPDNAFKGLQPVTGENTRIGWIRYCVGLFKTFEPANLVKADMRNSGYKDAFVVAYLNGKRISLSEASVMLKKDNAVSGKTYETEKGKELTYLRSISITPASAVSAPAPDKEEIDFYGSPEKAVSASRSVQSFVAAGPVEYTVQVGVYRTAAPPSVLASLQPLNTETTSKGLVRFMYGRYATRTSADSAKRIAVSKGVPDAFVTTFRSGKAVVATVVPYQEKAAPVTSETPVASVTPVASEKRTESTAPGSSNGMVIFKVQLGAFRQAVPYDQVEAFLRISDKGITQENDPRGYHIFYAGSFTDFQAAMDLKAEVVGKGVKDAFVVALQNGVRIPVQEAVKLQQK
jgi:hypothetical protein